MTKINNTSRILISPRVRKGDGWLFNRNPTFRRICRKVVEGFTEDLEIKGHNDWAGGTIDNFVVLGTTPSRAKQLTRRGKNSDYPYLEDEFYYKMGNDVLVPEKMVVLIETYGVPYSDFIKWRTRNTFGKIIDNAYHPNGFSLEAKVYSLDPERTTIVLPKCGLDIFYVHGDRKFRETYSEQISKEPLSRRHVMTGALYDVWKI